MALNKSEMRSNGVKTAVFSKKYEKSRIGWGIRYQTPLNDTFEIQYASLLNTALNLDICIL